MTAVPCRFCGIATDPATAIQFHPSQLPLDKPTDLQQRAMRGERLTVALGTCPECQTTIVDRAADAMTPALMTRFGNVAHDKLVNAYAALAAIGHVTNASPASLIARLGTETSVQWVRQFLPTQYREDGTIAAARWSFVTSEQRADIMAAYVAAVTPPKVHPAPAKACAFCGVGQARSWLPISAKSASLGGRSGPGHVKGHLCDECASAFEAVGAIGPTAMERAYLGSQHVAQSDYAGLPEVPGLRGWAVSGRTEANAKPWAHVR
jgi:hypothetical protein